MRTSAKPSASTANTAPLGLRIAAIGGLLGTFGPRFPLYAAAAVSTLNLIYGCLVLPETLPPGKRRRFELARANPLGTFKVFRSYVAILPLCAVLFVYFFASSVYPAIWAFWGIAKFGWSEAMIGLTLAAFGVTMAVVQVLLTGPAVARLGEHTIVLLGLVLATVASIGYGLATSLAWVLVLLVVHAPEGLVHPVLTAVMSKRVPADAQGELQGGISGIMSIAMPPGLDPRVLIGMAGSIRGEGKSRYREKKDSGGIREWFHLVTILASRGIFAE